MKNLAGGACVREDSSRCDNSSVQLLYLPKLHRITSICMLSWMLCSC